MNPILVTGATGTVGVHVVQELLGRGVSVRVFVRDPGRAARMFGDRVGLATGDLADPASIRTALDGVDRVLLCSANHPQQVEHETNVIDAATQLSAGIGRPVAYVDVPDAVARDGLIQSGMPQWLAEELMILCQLRSGAAATTTDVVRVLTGQDPRTVAEFARDHVAAFRSFRSRPLDVFSQMTG